MHNRTRLRVALLSAAMALSLAATPAPTSAYPSSDEGYLDYAEMVAAIREVEAAHPDIVQLFSIGESHEGRQLWAAKVSDNVAVDEGEPEVVFDAGIHGREHMSTEMAVALLRNLAAGHATTPRISDMVNGREIFILFNLNPDGSEFDHASGVYRSWRKNRQPTPGSSEIGTDINRNFGYRWGTNPLNASPAGETYRGPSAWSTPEARAFRDFVESRVIGGVQQIRVHATFHQYGRIVLYPYGYTTTPVPSDMEADDHATLTAMAGEMARLSGYAAGQSSHPNINVGNQMDWMYATHRIMTFTFEMGDTFYMPDEAIPTETGRNMEAAHYAIEQAAAPSRVTRHAGADRYGTAAAVSAASYSPGVAVAYVATGTNFPDALAAGAAAARAGGPVLLVTASRLPAPTAVELARLRPGIIKVVGGPAVVSDGVLEALRPYATSGNVQRIFGANRFATAAQISADAFPSGVATAYIATGSNFPDALAGVAAAGKTGGPILLTGRDSLNPHTRAELARLRPARIVILGGTAVVSSAVASQLAPYAITGSVQRLAGADRYSTAAAVSSGTFATADTVFIATGTNFPDALGGGPVAGRDGAPLLLVPSGSVPASVAAELRRLNPARVIVLGGTSVVSVGVAAQIDSILGD